MKKWLLLTLILSGVLLSCGNGADPKADTGFPRDKTLYIGGFQWSDPNSFNPLIDRPAWPTDGYFNIMYEPLMMFNYLTDTMEALLATEYIQDEKTITVTMNPKARWSDGTPLTAADVKFTYDIAKDNPITSIAYVWSYIDTITIDTLSDSSGTVERVVFAIGKERNNPLNIIDYFQKVRIVPRHIFSKLIDSLDGDFSALQKMRFDDNPVVSGPYNLLTYSNEKIILKRRDDYWGNEVYYDGKLPKPEYVIQPIFKSNDHISIELQQGGIDVSGSFIPRIWMKKTNKVETWYKKPPYFVPTSITQLICNTTKYPLSEREFRRAMACAINYRDIKELAISGYSPDIQPGLILPFDREKKFFSAEDAKKYGTVFDPDRAKKILKDAGFVSEFDANGKLLGMKNAQGEEVPTLFITSPAGWNDWETAVKIAVRDMRSVGIDIREGFIDAASYYRKTLIGQFDLLMFTPSPEVTSSKPWSRFEAVLSSRNWKPIGEKMNENLGRFNQPGTDGYIEEIDHLLRTLPAMTDHKEIVKAYRALNVHFMREQPTINLYYRPEMFYEFSTRNWTGFPDENNPYATPQCACFGTGIRTLWNIRLTKAE